MLLPSNYLPWSDHDVLIFTNVLVDYGTLTGDEIQHTVRFHAGLHYEMNRYVSVLDRSLKMRQRRAELFLREFHTQGASNPNKLRFVLVALKGGYAVSRPVIGLIAKSDYQ